MCKCPRDVHDVIHRDPVDVVDRLGIKHHQLTAELGLIGPHETEDLLGDQESMDHPSSKPPGSSTRAMPLTKGRPSSSDVYSWIPAGLGPDRVSYGLSLSPAYKQKLFWPPTSDTCIYISISVETCAIVHPSSVGYMGRIKKKILKDDHLSGYDSHPIYATLYSNL